MAGAQDFDTLRTALIQKYGHPASEDVTRGDTSHLIKTVRWKFPSTSILLMLEQSGVLPNLGNITLDYTAADKYGAPPTIQAWLRCADRSGCSCFTTWPRRSASISCAIWWAPRPRVRSPASNIRRPEYVRFERPPAIEYPEPIALETGEKFEARIKYFDYGVASVELKLEFEADWEQLIRLSNRWILAPEIERRTAELIQSRMERAAPALVQAYPARLSEDYYIIHLREALDEDGQPLTAPVMLSKHGEQIAQIVRGESQPLAESERREVLAIELVVLSDAICW